MLLTRSCVLLSLLVSACRGPSAPTPTGKCEPPACGLIDADGVDQVRIGGTLLPDLVPEDPAAYVSRYIADAQPVEGFRLARPPVVALVRGGLGAEDVDKTKAHAEAVHRGRAGRLIVTAVHIEDPLPRTAKGVGVGSTFADLKRAYGRAQLGPVPSTYGKDECAGTVPELGYAVVFYFASCEAAEAGDPVVRVIVFGTTPEADPSE